MKLYTVTWSKTYYTHGEEIIEARSRVEAEEIAQRNSGDYEGSMLWNPDETTAEACFLKDIL
jgi:hypothetical protein|tara:strand:- start:1 stop:186 length:186 start_codon:yes stop_codon:yes gene_type:complete